MKKKVSGGREAACGWLRSFLASPSQGEVPEGQRGRALRGGLLLYLLLAYISH